MNIYVGNLSYDVIIAVVRTVIDSVLKFFNDTMWSPMAKAVVPTASLGHLRSIASATERGTRGSRILLRWSLEGLPFSYSSMTKPTASCEGR
jgi:uncharacterized membrane protein